jgi:hypothetical protein
MMGEYESIQPSSQPGNWIPHRTFTDLKGIQSREVNAAPFPAPPGAVRSEDGLL